MYGGLVAIYLGVRLHRREIQQKERALLNQRWMLAGIPLLGLLLGCSFLAFTYRQRQQKLKQMVDEQTRSLRRAKEEAEAQNREEAA